MTLTNTERTEDQAARECAWIVRAEWLDSSPTYHGPFPHLEHAEQWARDEFADNDACTFYAFGVLSPVPS